MCLSTYTVLISLNKHLLHGLSIFVGILFCKAEGPEAWSLTTGLVARIWGSHWHNLASLWLGTQAPPQAIAGRGHITTTREPFTTVNSPHDATKMPRAATHRQIDKRMVRAHSSLAKGLVSSPKNSRWALGRSAPASPSPHPLCCSSSSSHLSTKTPSQALQVEGADCPQGSSSQEQAGSGGVANLAVTVSDACT